MSTCAPATASGSAAHAERANTARLLVSCPERPGIVSAVAGFLDRRIERTVLARAVRWHLEDRVLVHENRTVVFR